MTIVLGSAKFEKPTAEIVEKAQSKILQLTQKVMERERRIQSLRDSNEIDESALLQLLAQARRDSSSPTFTFCTSMAMIPGTKERTVREKVVGASVVNQLLEETEKLQQNRSDIESLNVIVRNLRPLRCSTTHEGKHYPYTSDSWPLSFAELEFLGF